MADTLLISGSRVLAERPEAERWARKAIGCAVFELASQALIVTGDASGPDGWAYQIGRMFTQPLVVFHRDGLVSSRDGAPQVGPWSTEPNPAHGDHAAWRKRLLARDAAMVSFVKAQAGARRCLALVAPWSSTHGTRYTARLAREAEIAVTELACPVALGPDGGPRD